MNLMQEGRAHERDHRKPQKEGIKRTLLKGMRNAK